MKTPGPMPTDEVATITAQPTISIHQAKGENMKTTPDRLLTFDDVISLLGLHNLRHPRRVINRLIRSGRLPAIRITRDITRFRPADVGELQHSLRDHRGAPAKPHLNPRPGP